MPVTNTYLNEAVQNIWSDILAVDIAPMDSTTNLPGPDPDKRGVTGLIQIDGVWNGAVMLSCLKDTAVALTQLMFGMEDEEPSEEEIQDAFGELTNMVGGCLKLELGEPSRLSLPTVIEGQQYGFSIPRSICTKQIDYHCLGQRVHLRIYETNGAHTEPVPTTAIQHQGAQP